MGWSVHYLQTITKEWRDRNFPDSTAEDQLFGVMEELGELVHVNLKSRQGIRGYSEGSERTAAEERDAIGDMMIYLMGFCSKRGYDLTDCVNEAWAQVEKRDWIKNPETAGTE